MSKFDNEQQPDQREELQAARGIEAVQTQDTSGAEAPCEFKITVRKVPAKVQARGVLAE